MVGAQGHVMAYETRPVVQQILRQNLDVNRVAGIVTLMRRDLAGPRRALTEFGEATSAVADSTVVPIAATAVDTVDDLLLDRLDLLKMDSAVDAVDILEGAHATLWRLRPIAFVSAVDEAALTSLVGRMREFGYRCWRMETTYFHPGNFNRRDTDIFHGATALALLAIPEEVEVTLSLDGCVEVMESDDRGYASGSQQTEPERPVSPEARVAADSREQGLLRILRKLTRSGK